MKRNIIYTAACLVAFASCQKQEVAEAPSQVEVAVELTASAAADATKTVMTEYNAHWWSVSDKISLFYTVEGKTGHSVFTSKNYIPAASAKFAGSLSLPAEDTDLTTVSALAVYPATTADASDGTSVNVTVPSVQTAVEGSFMEGAYPVVAKTSDLTAALSFKAVCGGVKVSFQTPGITSFTFDAKGAKIAGTASVKIGEDGTPVATLGKDAVSKITVNAPAGGFEVGKWYYMTAFPATLTSGYTVTLSNDKSFGGTSSIAIKRSVFGVLDSKDAPDTYADIKANLKPISWWDENKNDMSEPVHAGVKGDQYQWKYNLNCIRFESDANYLYGYVEYTGTTDLSKFKNLGIWLDVDGPNNGIGGWLFNAYPHFDKIVYGGVDADGNMIWKTKFYPNPTGAPGATPSCGKAEATASDAGYGEGSFENGVFKYSFIIDRRIVGLRNASSAVVGICFDSVNFSSGSYLTCPDRAGYIVSLKNSDLETVITYNISKYVKDFDYWRSEAIAEQVCNKNGYDKGNSVVKFSCDGFHIYGYFKVNSDEMMYGSEFWPAILRNFALCLDRDGITEGQGPNGGWVKFDYDGYDTVLAGSCASTKITDFKTWNSLDWTKGIAAVKTSSTTDYRPEYVITPNTWNPKVYDMSSKIYSDWVSDVLLDISDAAIGKGSWNESTHVFEYSFVLDKEKLGLLNYEELNIGIAFNYQHNGYVCMPSSTGFTIKLNN